MGGAEPGECLSVEEDSESQCAPVPVDRSVLVPDCDDRPPTLTAVASERKRMRPSFYAGPHCGRKRPDQLSRTVGDE